VTHADADHTHPRERLPPPCTGSSSPRAFSSCAHVTTNQTRTAAQPTGVRVLPLVRGYRRGPRPSVQGLGRPTVVSRAIVLSFPTPSLFRSSQHGVAGQIQPRITHSPGQPLRLSCCNGEELTYRLNRHCPSTQQFRSATPITLSDPRNRGASRSGASSVDHRQLSTTTTRRPTASPWQ